MLLRNGAVPQGARLNVITEDGGTTTVPVVAPRPGEPLVLRLAPNPGSAIQDGAADLSSAVPDDVVFHQADRSGSGTPQPMVEILAVGQGRLRAANRLTGTALGAGVRVVEVKEDVDERGWPAVHVVAGNAEHHLSVDCLLSSPPGAEALRVQVRGTNTGAGPIVLHSVTSRALRVCLSGDRVTATPAQDLELLSGRSDWLGEGRWQRRPLRSAGLPDLALPVHGQGARNAVIARSQGSWSTDGDLPVGGLIGDGQTLLWQVESSGGWRWEIGEDAEGAFLALSGPTDEDHQWQLEL